MGKKTHGEYLASILRSKTGRRQSLAYKRAEKAYKESLSQNK